MILYNSANQIHGLNSNDDTINPMVTDYPTKR